MKIDRLKSLGKKSGLAVLGGTTLITLGAMFNNIETKSTEPRSSSAPSLRPVFPDLGQIPSLTPTPTESITPTQTMPRIEPKTIPPNTANTSSENHLGEIYLEGYGRIKVCYNTFNPDLISSCHGERINYSFPIPLTAHGEQCIPVPGVKFYNKENRDSQLSILCKSRTGNTPLLLSGTQHREGGFTIDYP